MLIYTKVYTTKNYDNNSNNKTTTLIIASKANYLVSSMWPRADFFPVATLSTAIYEARLQRRHEQERQWCQTGNCCGKRGMSK